MLGTGPGNTRWERAAETRWQWLNQFRDGATWRPQIFISWRSSLSKIVKLFLFNTSDRKLCFCFLKLEIQPSDGIHLNHFTLISHYRRLKVVMCEVCLNNARRLGIKYRLNKTIRGGRFYVKSVHNLKDDALNSICIQEPFKYLKM